VAAEFRGFSTLYIIGDITLGASDDVDGFQIVGQNQMFTTITVTSGCSTNGTEFSECTLTGTLSGEVEIKNSIIDNLSGFIGGAHNCSLAGTITLAGTSSDIARFIECYLGTTAIGLVEINMNGDGAALSMRPYTGGVKISNKSGTSKVAIDLVSGRLEIASSVTGGTFFVRGVGEITDNQGTGITLHDDPLTSPASVADATWNEDITQHTTSDSAGEALGFIFDEASGRMVVDTVNKQLIHYKADGVTVIATWNLFDKDGTPASEDVTERVRV
jgi:hypothetical protein